MLSLIASVDNNGGIGKDSQLLLRIHADLRRFKQLTLGNTVIMGRKTLLTLPGQHALAGRKNIVLSRSEGFAAEGAVICRSAEQLFEELSPDENAFVIGGESVYRLLLPYCSHAYLTEINKSFEADSFLPDIKNLPGWQLQSRSEPMLQDDTEFCYADYVNSAHLLFQ